MRKYLCLAGKPPEGAGVNDAGAVSLKGRAVNVFRFRMFATGQRIASSPGNRVGRQSPVIHMYCRRFRHDPSIEWPGQSEALFLSCSRRLVALRELHFGDFEFLLHFVYVARLGVARAGLLVFVERNLPLLRCLFQPPGLLV